MTLKMAQGKELDPANILNTDATVLTWRKVIFFSITK